MRIKKDFTLRTVMGQNVVMAEGSNADTFGKLITLNSTAALVWKELRGKEFDVDTVASLLESTYAIPRSRALDDAAHLIGRLTSAGLLTP